MAYVTTHASKRVLIMNSLPIFFRVAIVKT